MTVIAMGGIFCVMSFYYLDITLLLFVIAVFTVSFVFYFLAMR